MIEDLIKELERLQKAEKLLERVYIYSDRYGDYEGDSTLRNEINNFFGFDDSE